MTGERVWKGEGYLINAGQRVVYVSNDVNTGSLTAFDGQDSAFAKLWSMKSPVPNQEVRYYAVANHIIAIAPRSQQLWVLQTGTA